MGNQNLKGVGVPIEWTEEKVSELKKCREDQIYFIKKYCKIVHVDKGLINFELWPFQEEMVRSFENNRYTICKLLRQCGKALPLDTPILTDHGFVSMGDLKVGDKIFGRDGKLTNITYITETMYDHEVYEIEFDNGDVIKADAEHLWNIDKSGWVNGEKTLTTKQILDHMGTIHKPFIHFTKPLDLPNKEFKMDPYLLGIWLGDENAKGTKIPPEISEYFLGSYDQRLELLRGLMDSGGSVRMGRPLEFYQKNESLVDDVRTLLSSLGIKSRKTFKLIDGVRYWTVKFTTKERVFNLKTKYEKQDCPVHHKNSRLYIKSITKVDSVPVRCLQVDNADHMFLCGTTLIPTHNTTTTCAFVLHKILFNDNYLVAVLANKDSQAREILSRVKLMFEYLPDWLQQGVKRWNEGDIELENGSKVMASATGGSAVRGKTFSCLICDEFAFIPNNIQEDFFASVYPTITSGTTTKVIITSTPNGMNLFYRLWTESEEGRNLYHRCEVNWFDVPGRDEQFKKDYIANSGERQWQQEMECQFLGSSNTLIEAGKLQQLAWKEPLHTYDRNLHVHEEPKPGATYLITVDTARGVGGDYSAFVVLDISQIPYKIVAKYKDNEISPLIYPNVIARAGMYYNNAMILVEVNDIGQQVADILHYDLEYDGVLTTQSKGRNGLKVGGSFTGTPTRGVRTTKQVKRIGCSNLKSLIEGDKLLISDYDIIYELFRFVESKGSYEAEDGEHDDLVMCLVLFAWLVNQDYFKGHTETDARLSLYEDNKKLIEESITPFGFIIAGSNLEDNIVTLDEFYNMDIHTDGFDLDEFNDMMGEFKNFW